MGKTTRPYRGNSPTKQLDLSPLKQALMDRRVWTGVGVVYRPDGESQHFEVDGEDVLIHLHLVPDGTDLTARLGTFAGGAGMGLWRVPAAGDEVAVLIPAGELGYMPIVVGVLSSGQAPARVAENRTILVATDTVEITAPRVVLGPDPDQVIDAQDGFVHAKGTDPYTGMQYWMLGNASAKVVGNK
jgi:hypothetical protein